VTHGAEDKNTTLIAAECTAKMTPGAKLSVYLGIGFRLFSWTTWSSVSQKE
jgi:hypothetical protein